MSFSDAATGRNEEPAPFPSARLPTLPMLPVLPSRTIYNRRDMSPRIGILLGQLGTPDAPTYSAVRRYLKQFLSDRRVVDLSPIKWWLILNGIILTFRPWMSARLYRKVWTEEGSPLLVISRRQAAGLEKGLNARGGTQVKVEVAMRYGNPSTGSAIDRLIEWGAHRILLFPMYPQYSASTTGSTCDEVFAELGKKRDIPALRIVPPYYEHPRYIATLAEMARASIAAYGTPDRFLLSFHGIPERYARLGDPYPSHCKATAKALAYEMGWSDKQYSLTFQSRFGKEPWLHPYTDETLMALGGKGVRRLVAMCPGFTADCLETTDEIGNLGREQFEGGGGEHLHLVPCLNDHPRWIEAMVDIAENELKGWR